MYTFKQNLVSKDKYSIKCPYAMKVEYITVHDTANRATAENEIKYMISNDKEVSFHLAVLGEGNGNPLQYSCLENPMDRGA